jgi:predicted transcriptional regulator
MSTVTVWGRLTPQERERLEALARDEDRSLSYVISRILREKLAEQPKQKVLHDTGE